MYAVCGWSLGGLGMEKNIIPQRCMRILGCMQFWLVVRRVGDGKTLFLKDVCILGWSLGGLGTEETIISQSVYAIFGWSLECFGMEDVWSSLDFFIKTIIPQSI